MFSFAVILASHSSTFLYVLLPRIQTLRRECSTNSLLHCHITWIPYQNSPLFFSYTRYMRDNREIFLPNLATFLCWMYEGPCGKIQHFVFLYRRLSFGMEHCSLLTYRLCCRFWWYGTYFCPLMATKLILMIILVYRYVRLWVWCARVGTPINKKTRAE
jgi:hypothetical protein